MKERIVIALLLLILPLPASAAGSCWNSYNEDIGDGWIHHHWDCTPGCAITNCDDLGGGAQRCYWRCQTQNYQPAIPSRRYFNDPYDTPGLDPLDALINTPRNFVANLSGNIPPNLVALALAIVCVLALRAAFDGSGSSTDVADEQERTHEANTIRRDLNADIDAARRYIEAERNRIRQIAHDAE